MDLHDIMCASLSLCQDLKLTKPEIKVFVHKNCQELTERELKIALDYVDQIEDEPKGAKVGINAG